MIKLFILLLCFFTSHILADTYIFYSEGSKSFSLVETGQTQGVYFVISESIEIEEDDLVYKLHLKDVKAFQVNKSKPITLNLYIFSMEKNSWVESFFFNNTKKNVEDLIKIIEVIIRD